MAKVKVLAGDFLESDGEYSWGSLKLKTKEHSWVGETIPLNQLDTVDIATEESVKKIGGTVGWGAAGAVILGPVGLLAGLLLGGKKKEVTFVAKFKDGRKLMASTDSKTFTKLQAAVFNNHKGRSITTKDEKFETREISEEEHSKVNFGSSPKVYKPTLEEIATIKTDTTESDNGVSNQINGSSNNIDIQQNRKVIEEQYKDIKL